MGGKKNEYVIYDDFAEVVLYSPKYGEFKVKIDLEDMEKCKERHWCVSKCSTQNYKCFYVITKGIMIHRYIMTPEKGMVVDHENGDTLDNRKINLRICTDAKNKKNCKLYSNNKSGHKGVIWNKSIPHPKWMAYICIDTIRTTLGYFDKLEDAVKCRKDAEEKYFGEYARN